MRNKIFWMVLWWSCIKFIFILLRPRSVAWHVVKVNISLNETLQQSAKWKLSFGSISSISSKISCFIVARNCIAKLQIDKSRLWCYYSDVKLMRFVLSLQLYDVFLFVFQIALSSCFSLLKSRQEMNGNKVAVFSFVRFKEIHNEASHYIELNRIGWTEWSTVSQNSKSFHLLLWSFTIARFDCISKNFSSSNFIHPVTPLKSNNFHCIHPSLDASPSLFSSCNPKIMQLPFFEIQSTFPSSPGANVCDMIAPTVR